MLNINEMKKLKVIKKNGIYKDWELDPIVDYDIFQSNENSINLSVLDGLTISDLFQLGKDDFPILTDVFLMTEDDIVDLNFVNAIGLYRRDDKFSIAFMFDEATVVDEILGYPANTVVKYLELVAKNKPYTEIRIPFEFEDGATMYLGISADLETTVEDLFSNCHNLLVELIRETTDYIDSLEKAISAEKFVLNIPTELKTPISQYLLFFSSYINKTKGEVVGLKILEIENGLELTFDNHDNSDIETIKEWMIEFISHIRSNSGNYEINYETKRTENEQKILVLSLNQQVSHLQNSIDIIKIENQFLKENNQFFKELLLSITSQKVQVNNLISNDTYNYIDKTISEYDLLTNNDREFIKLIYENTETEAERKELVDSLKNLKDPSATSETKEKSKSIFRKFIETGLSEASKQMFKRLIDMGLENLPI